MKKKTSHHSVYHMPIDSRLIPDIFSFSHVKGISRIFLIIEMSLATMVVLGTVLLVFLSL